MLENTPRGMSTYRVGGTKQKGICHSSYGAEILACAEGGNRRFHVRNAMISIFLTLQRITELVVEYVDL